MNFTQKTNDLMAILSVEVKEVDYRDRVEKELKRYRQTAQIPGFRKGKIPISIINKKYRKSCISNTRSNSIFNEVKKECLTS